jgi:PAS domain S-box-containing protein
MSPSKKRAALRTQRPVSEHDGGQDHQARLAGIVDSAMDAIISIDKEQRILLFNAAAETMFGCSASEVLGHSIERFIPPEARKAHGQYVRGFGQTGVTSRSMRSLGTLKAVRSHGEEFPIEASISHVEVAGQQVFTVILRDISERHRAEQALRESEDRLHAVTESLSEGLVLAGLDGQLLHWNRAGLGMFGFRDLEECLRSLPEFGDTFELSTLSGEVLPFDRWPLARVLAGEPVRDVELRVRRRTGEPLDRIYSYSGTIIHDVAGKPLAFVSVDDVTEEKLAQEKIQRLNAELEQRVTERTAQLEEANRELEAFSYSVSHDLRAPLRAVDGFSLALIEDFGDLLPAEGVRYLNTIRAGAQRMGRLIDDLLAFSRLNRKALNSGPVDAERLVGQAIEELSGQLKGRNLVLNVEKLVPCSGDPALLGQVWINLLSNAIKYTRNCEKAVIEVGSRVDGEEIVYFVGDNGTGFDMRYADKLFGVFQRLHRVEDFEGTGVGLAIVQRVIHRHGGRVWAEAELGKGATFSFALPKEAQF